MDIRKRKFKGIFALSAAVILLAFAVGIFAWITPNKSNIKDNVADSMGQSAITELASTTTSYGKFANKSKYTFTDKTKITSYRASADNTGTDTTTIVVDSSATHGSQSNPYVIDNFAGWTHFVTEMQENSSSSYTYGQGKYYVLAVDLDFDASGAPAEKPLFAFGGTLYGLGHTISNWKYVENSTLGQLALIRYSYWTAGSNVTIADLNMYNYQISNGVVAMGVFFGHVLANQTWVLNCHTKGEIYRNTPKQNYIWAGGLIGAVVRSEYNMNGSFDTDATIYRCSADFKFSITDTSIPASFALGSGGLVGFVDRGCSISVYDCYSISNHIYNTNGGANLSGIYTGGLIGVMVLGKTNSRGGECIIKGGVSKIVTDLSNANNSVWYSGGSTVFYENEEGNIATTAQIEDIYVSGVTKWSSSQDAMKSLPWLFRNSSGGNTSNKMGWVKSAGDIYYTGEASNQGVWWIDGSSIGNLVSGSNEGTLLGTATTSGETQLWTTAKNSTKLKSKIWSQKENIGSTYTIQNSPVINKFDTNTFNITYKDAHTDGTDTVIGTSTYTYPNTPGLTAQANKTGKTFLGYTFDRTSMASPFKTLPVVSGSSYYGNLELYAVWDVADADVTKDITVSGGTEESGTIVADYGEVIMLTADINCVAMGSDVTLEYEWRQGATVVATGENLSLTNVADSGTYTLYYKIKSSTDTLWGSSAWRSAGSKTVRINGKTPTFDTSSFTLNKTAYIGMPMGDIDYFAQFLDDTSSPFVGGTITWNGGASAKIDEVSVIEKDGKLYYKTQITFTPDASQNPAYANYSSATADVEFEVEYARIVFNMEGINEPITIMAIYGNKYTAEHIANQFEKEFLTKLAEGNDPAYNKVKELVPYFDGVKINDYKANGADVVVNGRADIGVTFRDAEYTVTFIYKDENGISQTHTEQCHYGGYLTTTWLSVPTGYVVNPWRFTDNEGVQRTWRFAPEGDEPADQVTGDVTLESEFKELKLTLERIEVTPRGSYAAGTVLDGSNLSVIGHYTTDSGEPYKINLSSGNGIQTSFKVEVIGSADGALHVKNNVITVTHTYDGNTVKEEGITLNVTPLSVDTSNCGFESENIKYGERIILPTVRRLPDGVKSVSYRYFNGSTEIFDIAEIVGDPDRNMTYTVRAIFETEDDYTAEDLVAQLIITSASEEVYLVWDEPADMPYNGDIQYPKATVYRVSDGSKVEIELEYSGDTDKSGIGSYKVTASISSEYSIRAGDEECTFRIVEVVVDKPVFESGSMVYNGKEQTVVLQNFDAEYMVMELTSTGKDADTYTVRVKITDSNYKFADGSSQVEIDWTIDKAELSIIWDKFTFEYDGSEKQPKIKDISGLVDGESIDIMTEFAYIGDMGQTEVNSYSITATSTESSTWTGNYKLRGEVRSYVILPAGMTNAVLVIVEWENSSFEFNDGVQHPTAKAKDYLTGEEISDITFTYSGDYYTSKYAGEYECSVSVNSPYFVLEGGKCKYTITPDENGNGLAPIDPDEDGNGGTLEEILAKLKELPLWQLIASVISIILIIAFLSKTASNESKRKKAKKTIDKKYNTYYAAAFLGLSVTNWTFIACVLMGCALLSLIFMIISQKRRNSAEEELDDAKEEFEKNKEEEKERRRDEDMKMMFMHMMGGNAGNMQSGQQGGFAYAGQGLGTEEIRGIVSETMTAMLPNFQQYLPQQASTNDELVQKLIEQNAQNEEVVQKLIDQNEKLMKQLANKPAERIVEKEVASASISEEAIEKLASKLQPVANDDEAIKNLIEGQKAIMQRLAEQPAVQGASDETILKVVNHTEQNDETIKQLLKNQEKLMEKILELSAIQSSEPQVVEKIVEKEVKVEVPVEVEKVVEKVVEVPVEKIVEVPVEVEKVVEKIVEIPAAKPAAKAKVTAPRLTLDEAYAKLSAKQKKIFDTLKEYAMSKDKCKEKKSTYYILLGQSSVNPLVKLTIKKDTTVALFKMEDEFMKDIRRNATNDGTKVKVKETELIVGDMQALATAKEMVDLREDQIERYTEYLREQRSMKK